MVVRRGTTCGVPVGRPPQGRQDNYVHLGQVPLLLGCQWSATNGFVPNTWMPWGCHGEFARHRGPRLKECGHALLVEVQTMRVCCNIVRHAKRPRDAAQHVVHKRHKTEGLMKLEVPADEKNVKGCPVTPPKNAHQTPMPQLAKQEMYPHPIIPVHIIFLSLLCSFFLLTRDRSSIESTRSRSWVSDRAGLGYGVGMTYPSLAHCGGLAGGTSPGPCPTLVAPFARVCTSSWTSRGSYNPVKTITSPMSLSRISMSCHV